MTVIIIDLFIARRYSAVVQQYAKLRRRPGCRFIPFIILLGIVLYFLLLLLFRYDF